MRRAVIRVLVLAGAAGLILFLLIARRPDHKLVVRSYFSDARGLRARAPVRMAGVDVGSVRSVRVRPEAKDQPVEVVIVLSPSYDLKIPNDSVAMLSTAGILGETYINIDAVAASGPPIEANAVLKSKPTTDLSTQQMIEKLGEYVQKKNCDCDCNKKPADAGRLLSNRHE